MASALVRSALSVVVGGCAFACASLALPPGASGQAPPQAQPSTAAASAAADGVPFTPAPPVRSYVAIRRLHSENERHHKNAWLVARTELKEDGTFTWQVLEEGGSELIRNRVLHEALEKEEQVYRDGRARRGGLTTANYLFSSPTPHEGALRVGLEPRRREDMLLRGALLMAPDGELLQVEGDLVKRPSFWTKSVHLVRHYGRVDGTHVPLRLDMVAQVRLVGTSRLSMTYQYLQINGRPVVHDPQRVELLTRAGSSARPVAPR